MSIRFSRRLLYLVGLLLVVAAAAGYTALDRWQRATIFSVELGEARWAREAPAGTQAYFLETPDKEQIHAWYIAGQSADAPTVLYLHGSRWNLNSSVFRIERWLDMGYAMLAIDYRGFGESTPRLPSQSSAVADALVAIDELARIQPDPNRRFVYGHSLGGAIAAMATAQQSRPAVAGLILESTFTNITDMIATSRWADIPGLEWLVTQPFDTERALARLSVPTLIMHGTSDRVVPHAMSDRLFDAAQRNPHPASRLVKFEFASHSGASRTAGYDEAVTAFINAVTASR